MNQAVAILIDDREPAWVQRLTFDGVPTMVSRLDAGDLLISCSDHVSLIVERKSPSDFLASLSDDRLFDQVARLRTTSPWAYLAVTGDLSPGPNGTTLANGRTHNWNWHSVAGALLTVQESGVSVLTVPDEPSFEAAILMLARRSRSVLRVPPARAINVMSQPEAILASLPGIGPERATAVLDYCGNVAAALMFLTADDPALDGRVPGIGVGIKRRVREALGLDGETELFLVPREDAAPDPMEVG